MSWETRAGGDAAAKRRRGARSFAETATDVGRSLFYLSQNNTSAKSIYIEWVGRTSGWGTIGVAETVGDVSSPITFNRPSGFFRPTAPPSLFYAPRANPGDFKTIFHPVLRRPLDKYGTGFVIVANSLRVVGAFVSGATNLPRVTVSNKHRRHFVRGETVTRRRHGRVRRESGRGYNSAHSQVVAQLNLTTPLAPSSRKLNNMLKQTYFKEKRNETAPRRTAYQ